MAAAVNDVQFRIFFNENTVDGQPKIAIITEQQLTPFKRQLLAASGNILLVLIGAMVSGYSAILLPQLKEDAESMPISKFQETWIASAAPLPMALGCIVGGASMDLLGRINCNNLACLTIIAGWSVIYMADTVEELVIGRLLTGFCVGLTSPGPTCYIGETAHPKYRGLFLAATVLGVALGFFLTHLLGTFMHWRSVAAAILFLPWMCLAIFNVIPESHVTYMRQGRVAEAKSAFYWFRGRDLEAEEELQKLLQARPPQRRLADVLQNRFLKPLFILNLFFVTAQFSGNNAVVYYCTEIAEEAISGVNKFVVMLSVDLLRVIACVWGCIATKVFNVRPLALTSGVGSAVSLYLLALFSHLSDVDPVYSNFALLSLVSFIAFLNVGLRPLPWALCGELFPADLKGIGGGISTCVNFLCFFVVVKTNPDMMDALGASGTFLVYGTIVLTGTLFLYAVLPETKNRTLGDIEEFFRG